jgi:hypothetical protein
MASPPIPAGGFVQDPPKSRRHPFASPGEEHVGQRPDILTASGPVFGGRSGGPSEAAQYGPALLVQKDVGGLDSAVGDAKVVQIRDGRCHRGTDTGHDLNWLRAGTGQVAFCNSPQDDPVGWIATLDLD